MVGSMHFTLAFYPRTEQGDAHGQFNSMSAQLMYYAGFDRSIREAYTWICENYTGSQDEIILTGFSRGAFAVRALAHLIDSVGVLRKSGIRYLHLVFERWKSQQQNVEGTQDLLEDGEGQALDASLLHRHVKIKACAVWDTVAALSGDKLDFVNEVIPGNVELAVQALALNEGRRQFKPLLWKKSPSKPKLVQDQTLKQCWFLGAHSDIGGGNKHMGLANIAFAWMITQLDDVIAFDMEVVFRWSEESRSSKRLASLSDAAQKFTLPGSDLEVTLRVPVRFFQAKTDVHVSASARLQRIGGWVHRKPFTSGTDAGETLHWSVQSLRDKRVVSACVPLDNLEQHGDQNTQNVPRVEEAKGLERRILEGLIMRNCGAWLKDESAEVLENYWLGFLAPKSTVMRGSSAALIPIYAVIWDPESWFTREGARFWQRPIIGIEVKRFQGRRLDRGVQDDEIKGGDSLWAMLLRGGVDRVLAGKLVVVQGRLQPDARHMS